MIGAAPQLLDNPCCDFINQLPWGFFLLVHAALFAVGAYLAMRGYASQNRLFGTGFALFAAGEIVYATYHVNITQFLFAHTIAEVLVGIAFVVLFVAAVRSGAIAAGGRGSTARERAGAR